MWHHVLAALACLLTLLASGFAMQLPAWPVAFAPPEPGLRCIGRSVFEVDTFHIGQRYAHAATAVMLRDGRMRAVWYDGTNELNTDTRLWSATYDGSQWSRPRIIVGPEEAAAGSGRFVRKVGNSLIYRDAGGELVLVFATSFVGGWDGVSLKLTRSRDEGETWAPPRNLTTSPIFNLGTGVRGAAVPAEGGLTMIPTWREFMRTFSEVVLLDQRGRVINKRRIGVNVKSIQPFVSVRDARRAIVLMRPVGEDQHTLISRTADAANSWTDLTATTLRSSSTPVSVARIGDDLFVISSVLDPTSSLWSVRFSVLSDDDQTWRDLYSQEFGESSREIPRYPWMIAGPGGLYHVLFTLTRVNGDSELLHARISRDWIAARGGPPCP